MQGFENTATSTSQFVQFQASALGSGQGGFKATVIATRGNDRHITEILATHDGTTAVATEYGTVTTNSILATYDVDINASNIRLLITPNSATSTTFKTIATFIEA